MEDYHVGHLEGCFQCCLSQLDDFQQKHTTDHNSLPFSKFQKKISKKLQPISQLIQQRKESFLKKLNQIQCKMEELTSNFFNELEMVQYQFLFKKNNPDLAKKIKIIEQKQLKKLSCNDIHQIFKQWDVKPIHDEQKKKSLSQMLNRIEVQNSEKIAKKIQDIFELPFNADESSIMGNFTNSRISSKIFDKSSEQGFNLEFDSSADLKQIQNAQSKSSKVSSVQKMSIFNDGVKKQTNMKKKNNFEVKSENREVSRQIKTAKKQSRFIEQITDHPETEAKKNKEEMKKQNKNSELDVQNVVDSFSLSEEQIDEIIDKKGIKVKDLQKEQFLKQNNYFTITLKIDSMIMFRTVQRRKSGKKPWVSGEHKKVKFIAGDETGLVVCFTNWSDQIKVGNVVEIHNCQLQNFLEKSLEIISDDKKIKKCPSQTFQKMNYGFSLSQININKKSLTYLFQQEDKFYPTLRGLIGVIKSGEKKKLNFIVKVKFIIEDKSSYIQAIIEDFTGCTSAYIYKKGCSNIMEGDILHLLNYQVFEDKCGKDRLIYLGGHEGNVEKAEGFEFQETCEININEFIN